MKSALTTKANVLEESKFCGDSSYHSFTKLKSCVEVIVTKFLNDEIYVLKVLSLYIRKIIPCLT